MDNTVSYSISEAADLLNLSPKTIRRYIKSGKLPSTKVPTKFGDEYRITQIPENLQQEAAEQSEANSKIEMVRPEENALTLDTQKLYQENIRLAAQLGAATERIRQLEEQLKSQLSLTQPENNLTLPESQEQAVKTLEENIKLIKEAVYRPWWKKLLGIK